jgi:predicted nucleic acid-binding protein
VNALSQPIDRPKAHALIGIVRASAGYELVPAGADLFEKGLQLHAQRPDKEWSLTDCISFVVLSDRRIPRAPTHDHHYEQAGFEALLRRDPP